MKPTPELKALKSANATLVKSTGALAESIADLVQEKADLLEALKDMVFAAAQSPVMIEDNATIYNAARAAIAKAG